MIVMKFGGTSVESADAIERVAKIVASRSRRSPIVVVSAVAKVTDQLVAMGHKAAAGERTGIRTSRLAATTLRPQRARS